MLSFLEFYEVLVSFVNFKLFHSLGLTYPPVYDQTKVSSGEYLSALNTISSIENQTNGQPSIVEEVKKKIDIEMEKTKDFELKKKNKRKSEVFE